MGVTEWHLVNSMLGAHAFHEKQPDLDLDDSHQTAGAYRGNGVCTRTGTIYSGQLASEGLYRRQRGDGVWL